MAPVRDERRARPPTQERAAAPGRRGPAGEGHRARQRHDARGGNDAIEALFLELAKGASAGQDGALRRLRLLQKAIVDREEQGETLSRLLPGGVAERCATTGRRSARPNASSSPC